MLTPHEGISASGYSYIACFEDTFQLIILLNCTLLTFGLLLQLQLQLLTMAAKYSRRPSYLDGPLSPSIIPELAILPQPLPADKVPCGQLVSKTSKYTSKALEDRDYDDIGTRWYAKDYTTNPCTIY